MSEKKKPWWIKERSNPQLGVYYVEMGQMSKTEAKKHEKPLYGFNVMHRYENEGDYKDALENFKALGK